MGGGWNDSGEMQELLAADFEDVEISSLTDITKVRIDREQPVAKRRKQYLEKAGDFYLVRVGNIKVKDGFTEGSYLYRYYPIPTDGYKKTGGKKIGKTGRDGTLYALTKYAL